MLRRFLFALAALVLGFAGFVTFKMMQPPPDDLDLSVERTSNGGLYQVRFTPEHGDAAQGPIHAWLVNLSDVAGSPVSGARILVDGGMPQHGHGLPTSPAMKDEIAPGVYGIDGVKFSMSGWWEFRLDIDGPAGKDTATFNVVLD